VTTKRADELKVGDVFRSSGWPTGWYGRVTKIEMTMLLVFLVSDGIPPSATSVGWDKNDWHNWAVEGRTDQCRRIHILEVLTP